MKAPYNIKAKAIHGVVTSSMKFICMRHVGVNERREIEIGACVAIAI
jgi:hypothetical protein